MGNLGAPEILLILVVLVLLFGAKKLPELARGSGRALRIFKAETKGLIGDDDDETDAKGEKRPQDRSQPDRRELDRGPVQADSVRTDVSYDDQRRPETDR
jgi:sec-independent protein translocase protein TatA